MTNHDPKPPAIGSLMGRVAAAIASRGLPVGVAAKIIGVGLQTLQNHLAGEHVRSDSAQKYENWLTGRTRSRNIFVVSKSRPDEDVYQEDEPFAPLTPPANPWLVVDIFSGCGGLSLGFDLQGGRRQFRTILAIDNQAAPIEVLNRNAQLMGAGDHPIGRQVDLTEFMNEAEFLAFFIQHTAVVTDDKSLLTSLTSLNNRALPTFFAAVAAVDHSLIKELDEIRDGLAWRNAYEHLDRQSLNQTSVASFHDKLRLPRPSLRTAVLPRLLWEQNSDIAPAHSPIKPDPLFVAHAKREWDQEVANLSAKRQASGRGQLSASARRVGAFVAFLASKGMVPVRDAWIRWRARRLTVRTKLFSDERFAMSLRRLYATHCQVTVLVGGPPCQGFSRIGRGKIRSLRDARVQVHGDAEAGDARNLLFLQYVMVLGALRPSVFLFENVQHFQSTVKADGVEFQATEVLAEAIANMSNGEVTYEVSSKVLDASRHGIPQTRQRYFMAGVIQTEGVDAAARYAESCLSLRRLPEATLALALAGLPEPEMVGGVMTGGEAMNTSAPVTGPSSDVHPYTGWIRQSIPTTSMAPDCVDGHAARSARTDDATFFSLMGPGKRWMDYRADEAQTIDELGAVLDGFLALPAAALNAAARAARKVGQKIPERDAIAELRGRLNGSLPLRLLLEQASSKLGAPHHLLTEGYLAKKDGHHGDWVARMDASRPSKTIVSHMGKDTYAYIHPAAPRTISVREAARIQSFPDWFTLQETALTDGFKMIGNAVPPMLSYGIANRVARVLSAIELGRRQPAAVRRG
ncbi:DNA cytosine methyltransferase [Bradyrhizobium sediminis]|uniref:DNA (cytosine-5-)-methyltransferase n=1 Tax=Bradyrhizobium sediminis TaxID=2840469 RepID=A0A975RNB4_9BRAD|nr:DNA cytosine methyltransferase [Bradyrhizobium sediminis]QWG14295.1 DNA cytosine methyltransferase [Bradyrhizobium sediminis]